MSSIEAIKKLEKSNQHVQTIIDHLDTQLADIRTDPRLADLVDDLEKLFYAYLKTWIKSNSEVIELLSRDVT
jgi:hypothetical protein